MIRLKILLAAAALAFTAQAAVAGDRCCCPGCGKVVCVATCEPHAVDKYCYVVDRKHICIPRFRWPWQMCCRPKCSQVRTVNVLRKVDYECEHCGWVWKVMCVGKPCCGASGCAAGSIENADGSEEIPADTGPPPPPFEATFRSKTSPAAPIQLRVGGHR